MACPKKLSLNAVFIVAISSCKRSPNLYRMVNQIQNVYEMLHMNLVSSRMYVIPSKDDKPYISTGPGYVSKMIVYIQYKNQKAIIYFHNTFL